MDSDSICTICNEPLQNESQLVDCVKIKGLKRLVEKSKALEDDKWKAWSEKDCIFLHSTCRTKYLLKKLPKETSAKKRKIDTQPSSEAHNISSTNDNNASSNLEFEPSVYPSTSTEEFISDFSTLCFFCAKKLDHFRKEIGTLSSEADKNHILENLKQKNDLDDETFTRIEKLFSLEGPILSYHRNCYKHYLKVLIFKFLQNV